MKVDTKDLNKLTKLFNGVALSVFIDYCNYCDENPDKEPTYEELAKWTGKDLSTILFCFPFLKEQNYIKVDYGNATYIYEDKDGDEDDIYIEKKVIEFRDFILSII